MAENLPQFILTSIQVHPSPDEDGVVTFNGSIPGRNVEGENGALILTNVIRQQDSDTYQASIVDPKDFQSLVAEQKKHVLLCVHGFNTTPSEWLESCKKYSGEYLVIPVIWPCDGRGVGTYWTDKSNIQKAVASRLQVLFQRVDASLGPNKSIMCHSMGNYVLKILAPSAQGQRPIATFRSIFMVAADVGHDILEDGNSVHGNAILNLATHRIVVLYSRRDLAMYARLFTNRFKTALGHAGCSTARISEGQRHKVTNANARSFLPWWHAGSGHSYHFTQGAIDVYENPAAPPTVPLPPEESMEPSASRSEEDQH